MCQALVRFCLQKGFKVLKPLDGSVAHLCEHISYGFRCQNCNLMCMSVTGLDKPMHLSEERNNSQPLIYLQFTTVCL